MEKYYKLKAIEKGYTVTKTNRIPGFETIEPFTKIKADDFFIYKLNSDKYLYENQIFFDGVQIVLPLNLARFIVSLKIGGVQMIPAKIELPTGDFIENYFRLHVFYREDLIDLAKSDYEYPPGHELFDHTDYTKLVLSADKLKKLYLDEALILKVEESGEIIFHKSIVKKIEQFGVAGSEFVDVEV
jgi:hypothetical protein